MFIADADIKKATKTPDQDTETGFNSKHQKAKKVREEKKGEQGERGEQGAQGDKGVAGDKGEQGAPGEQGEVGPKGATGAGFSVSSNEDESEPSVNDSEDEPDVENKQVCGPPMRTALKRVKAIKWTRKAFSSL